jgi:hypothetical protein
LFVLFFIFPFFNNISRHEIHTVNSNAPAKPVSTATQAEKSEIETAAANVRPLLPKESVQFPGHVRQSTEQEEVQRTK